jgi:high-affinity iron transporter
LAGIPDPDDRILSTEMSSAAQGNPTSTPAGPPRRVKTRSSARWSFYVWVGVVLAVAVAAVILGWHSSGGTADPSVPGTHMSRTAAVINAAILVFREGLETILVLAAVTASFLGANRVYRRPVAVGGAFGLVGTIGTWFAAIWIIGALGGSGLDLQAATGIPAILVLLVVMNWFFHKVYWTGWISHHHKRRRGLLSGEGAGARRALIGLGLLGFTSIYREGFEIVIFLQNLRVTFGSSVVLEGVTLGALFTAAVGVLTFTLHQRLPYKRLLIITGGMLLLVLFVMVGEEVNEMQLAHWIGTTPIGVHLPGWLGQWFSIFPNVQTITAQVGAVAIVLGSYVAAQYLRVWRPRRRGQKAATVAERPPGPVRPELNSARTRAGGI